ncbi:TPA: hypothetical protein ROY17_005510 [Bacillus thuringiensis]|nr:hypothetical protein [Bacillus thuringiensis]
MKYKNRKRTQRKYKQTLVATVAVMTLGLSIGESFTMPSFAYATADSVKSREQQVKEWDEKQDKQAAFDKMQNDAQATLADIDALQKKVTVVDTITGAINVIGSAGDQLALLNKYSDFVKLAVTGNVSPQAINQVLKGVATTGASLIPGAGPFVSQILSVAWPNLGVGGPSQMEIIMTEVTKLIDASIQAYDKDTIRGDMKNLYDELNVLESLLNKKTEVGMPNGNVQASAINAVSYIKSVDGRLKDLVEHCRKPSQAETELPFFTIAATARLQFLKFIKAEGLKLNIGFDEKDIQGYAGDLESLTKEYRDYINKTSDTAQQKMYDNAKKIISGGLKDYSGYSINPKEEADKINSIAASGAIPSSTQTGIPSAGSPATQYLKAIELMNNYDMLTKNNEAFNIIANSISKPTALEMPQFVSIKAKGKNKFVHTYDQPGKPHLDANSNEVGDWEKFELVTINKNNRIYALKANAGKNENFVTFNTTLDNRGGMLSTGNSPTTTTNREYFTLIPLGGDDYAIRGFEFGNYVFADFNSGGVLVSASKHIGDWEVFTIKPYKKGEKA